MEKTKERVLVMIMFVVLICSIGMILFILLPQIENNDTSSELSCNGQDFVAIVIKNVSFDYCRKLCGGCACFDYLVNNIDIESSACRLAGAEVRYLDNKRAPLPSSTIDVSISVNDETDAKTSDTFGMIGVNFDFWPSSKPKWKQSGALEIDLNNRGLITLAKGLSGSLLRMGGSPADMLLYATYPDACSDENLNKTQKNGTGYYCPIWDQVRGQCLTMRRWKELNRFASKTGLQIAFDLNACWGRHSSTGEMDFNMIEGLIRETSAGKGDWANVFAFEFGNELYSNVAANRYASDLKYIKGLLKKYWGGDKDTVPKLLGPDCGAGYLSKHYLDSMLTAAEGNKTLHAVTIHLYGENGKCRRHLLEPGLVLNVTCMDSLLDAMIQYKNISTKHGVALWNGEGALQGNSGKSGLTDVFTSSFWYLNAMASFAENGIGLLSRQTLVGGDYELIDKVTFKPNPDYWALLLWHRLSGNSALRSDWLTCGKECSKCLRSYSRTSLKRRKLTIVLNFCTQLSFAINVVRHKNEKIDHDAGDYANYVEIYQLTGHPSSRIVKLNDKELVYDGRDSLPDLDPYIFPATSRVNIPATSITFINF